MTDAHRKAPKREVRRGARRVKSYRIYIVDPDGRLQLGQAFEAADDEAAGRRARGVAQRGRTAELWEGGRIVGRVCEDGDFTLGG